MAKAKGTVVVEVVKSLRRNRERAVELLPPKLHHYLQERIVVASWYPLDDYLTMLRAVGRIMAPKGAGLAVFEKMGREAARTHMDGTYARLKNATNRQASFTLLSSMYDTGELRVLEREPGHAVLEFVGFAQPARELCETFTGYQLERMAIQGFEDVEVRHIRCRGEGQPNCLWDVHWKGRRML